MKKRGITRRTLMTGGAALASYQALADGLSGGVTPQLGGGIDIDGFDGGVLGGPRGQIQLSSASFTANAAQGTAIGTLSVTGGTGIYTFTLTDSHSNAVQVAGLNGINLQVGASASSAGSFSITVHADNGAGSVLNRTFLITATASAYVPTYELIGF